MRRRFLLAFLAALLASCGGGTSSPGALTVRIPTGAGGVGFLPLLVMQKQQLLEKHAAAQSLAGFQVQWIDLGGPSAMNDALLAGSVDFIAAGPPAFLTLWDATRDSNPVLGVAAMSSLPMYLNVRAPHLNKLEDLKPGDKIGMTAIKVSIPALTMQMYAAEKFGPKEAARFDKFTVGMAHPDGVIAMLNQSGAINAHFTSPPFHQIERKNAQIRTILTTKDVIGPVTFTMVSTTKKFAEANPKVIAAFIAAMAEASQWITANKPAAADILMNGKATGEGGISKEDMAAVLSDPDIRFTQAPENVMKYANFMQSIGTLKQAPATWKDLFVPAVHALPGS